MKVLITGANGFIGGNLEQYLRGYGHDIYKAVRINSVENFDLKNIIIDWASLQSLNQAVKGVDLVIHAAGMGAKACELDPERALSLTVWQQQIC